ncbi:YodC family protein [Brenneria goodwinii]|uniref:YodC family protein n=1 Tax=Brenneria goodwinii TaxID=1109412 RepID=UPI0036E82368
MTAKYNIGTQVQLKSGGPIMTIQEAIQGWTTDKGHFWNKSYKCQWFAGKKLESGVFPHDSLEIATNE